MFDFKLLIIYTFALKFTSHKDKKIAWSNLSDTQVSTPTLSTSRSTPHTRRFANLFLKVCPKLDFCGKMSIKNNSKTAIYMSFPENIGMIYFRYYRNPVLFGTIFCLCHIENFESNITRIIPANVMNIFTSGLYSNKKTKKAENTCFPASFV